MCDFQNISSLQFSVGPDRPVKQDHLWRWTTLTEKFPPGPNRSIYVWTEISGNFGTMESSRGFPQPMDTSQFSQGHETRNKPIGVPV